MTGSEQPGAPSSNEDSSFSYPHGHVEHLSATETAALAQLKSLLTNQGIYRDGPPPSHDDATLVRFLRARRWVPQDAATQFADTETWRKTNDIETLYNTIDLEAYEQSRIMYPQWTGRRDRRGIPLYLFQIGALNSKAMSAYEKATFAHPLSQARPSTTTPTSLLRLFALYENLCRFAFPLCTQLQDRQFPGMPITMSTNIVDVSGVSLKQFWNLKGHMQAASVLATANYPETLDRIFIIGAPSFFSTVWGWVKRWFDPATVSKIFILAPHEVTPTLTSFVAPENLPVQYGGTLEFKWGDLPTVDPAWKDVITWESGYSSFPTGPLVWKEDSETGRLVCWGVGSDKGVRREVRICSVVKGYWEAWEKKNAVAGGAGVPVSEKALETVHGGNTAVSSIQNP